VRRIIAQIALARQYFFLQPVIAICGLLTIGLACLLPRGDESS